MEKKLWEKESEVESEQLAVIGLTDIHPSPEKSFPPKTSQKRHMKVCNISKTLVIQFCKTLYTLMNMLEKVCTQISAFLKIEYKCARQCKTLLAKSV